MGGAERQGGASAGGDRHRDRRGRADPGGRDRRRGRHRLRSRRPAPGRCGRRRFGDAGVESYRTRIGGAAMGLTRLAVERPLVIAMAIAALLLLGWRARARLPTELDPRVDIPTVTIMV